jgi:hypothetical protein
MRAPFIVAVAVAGLLAGSACAQETLTLDSSGETIQYRLRLPAQPASEAADEPDSPVETARLIARHLAAGDIEDAALLSNAPKRRFEVLADYREAVGIQEFRRVYGELADPRNPLLAEIAIGSHRALLWRLGATGALAVQYYVSVEGRFLLDDIPSVERARLRRVVEAYRSGQRRLPENPG